MELQELTAWVQTLDKEFAPIREAARELVSARPHQECLELAMEWYQQEPYQLRQLAVYVMGELAAQYPSVLDYLREQVSLDPNWKVQDDLARAFDRYCKLTGYEKALPEIQRWMSHPRATVRRAAAEGLRVWTSRPYFKQNPQLAVEMLAALREDESDRVRRSAGSALGDIGRKHPESVRQEISRWDDSDPRQQAVQKLAAKYLPPEPSEKDAQND